MQISKHSVLVFSRTIIDDDGNWSCLEYNGSFESAIEPCFMSPAELEARAEALDCFQQVVFAIKGAGGGTVHTRTWGQA
jgi:hypothetical protein